MNKEQLQHKAYHTYAAIGELSVRKKQLKQQLQQTEQKLVELEQEIVKLSKTTPTEENEIAEGACNVD